MFGFRLRIRFWKRHDPPVMPPGGVSEDILQSPPAESPSPGGQERPVIHVSPDILDPAAPHVVDGASAQTMASDHPVGGAATGSLEASTPVEVDSPPPAIPSLETESREWPEADDAPHVIHLEADTGPADDAAPGFPDPGGPALERAVAMLDVQAETTTEAPEIVRPDVGDVEGVTELDAELDTEPLPFETGIEAVVPAVDREESIDRETTVDADADLDEDVGSGLPQREVSSTEVSCPNCGEGLAVRPISRTTCGQCDRVIHVRARQTLFRSGLVGEDDVDAIDFLERVEPFGIEERQCLPLISHEPLADVLWQLCESRLETIPIARQAHLLNEMAQYLCWQGKDAAALRQRAEAASLLALKERGVERVVIVTRGEAACALCQENGGAVLDVASALEAQLLPVGECTSRSDCRCAYSEAD